MEYDDGSVGSADVEAIARTVAREEVASLCGLVLRRLQEGAAGRGLVEVGALSSVFGEALRDFGGESLEPGAPS